MIYVALKLDEYSNKLLKAELKPFIPQWNVFAENIIIHEGRARRNDIIGKTIDITAIRFGYTDDLMVVEVKEFEYGNPYIIIATSPMKKVKITDFGNIKTWFDIKIPIVLKGMIVEYKRGNGFKVEESFMDELKDKSQIIKVAFYDFDKTLVDTITSEEGRSVWEKKKKKKYPHVGWWSKKESLDKEVFDFKPIEEVTQRLNRDFEDKTCWTVLLTNRVVDLKYEVLDILGGFGLQLDELRMMERNGLNKNSRINLALESLHQVSMIDIYDDDMGNIEMFLSLKKKLIQNGKSVSIYHINSENFSPRLTSMNSN